MSRNSGSSLKKEGKIARSLKEAADILRVGAGKYDHIDFKPPESVARAAERGLEYRRKQKGDKAGLSTSEAAAQGIGSGVQRAVNLKNRNNLSPATVRRMHSFFSRHRKNKSIKAEHKGTPWKDKGWTSWLLWGGDPGAAWARKIIRQMDAADDKSKKAAIVVPVPPPSARGEHHPHERDATYMSRRQLRQMAAQAKVLSELVVEGIPLMDWQESKISTAAHDLNSIFNSLVYSERSPLVRVASDNEPTNPELWKKVQALTRGDQKTLRHDGKTINGPRDGKGFVKFPSAYANGWAVKTYNSLGGGWKKKKKDS